MKESDRNVLLRRINLTKDPKKNIFELDAAIYTDYNCDHEYGLRSVNFNNGQSSCICLDCGDALNERMYREIYNAPSKYNPINIRKRYLELLLTMGSDDAVEVLTQEFNLELVEEKLLIRRK